MFKAFEVNDAFGLSLEWEMGSNVYEKESWTGYKLHLDCIDGDIPVSTILRQLFRYRK